MKEEEGRMQNVFVVRERGDLSLLSADVPWSSSVSSKAWTCRALPNSVGSNQTLRLFVRQQANSGRQTILFLTDQ